MNPVVTFSVVRPKEASGEFRVGIRSVPYLADHGFQDMVVLPGSFYIDMTLRIEREVFKRVPRIVRNVIFHNPIILSTIDTVIKVEVTDHGDGRAEYTFRETGGEDGTAGSGARRHAAKLEIDWSTSTLSKSDLDALSIESFQARSHAVIDSEEFYRSLRENGNQYGPRFQNVASIWLSGDQSLGRLAVPRNDDGEIGPHQLDPSLLDSMTQLLAPFTMEKGKTFVLRSIEKVQVMDFDFPDTLWGHATLAPGGDGGAKGILGTVRVFDQSGKPYVELSGVAFTLLDRTDAADHGAAVNLVIASNFTADPVEDSLNFWGDHFGVRLRTEFAPYNQIFQQLLDTGSAFRRNSDGANVVLLGLEEWTTGEQRPPMTIDKELAEQCFGDRPRCVLPNGLEIVHLNQYETDYVYKEIFDDECYLKHGIRLHDGDTVVDVGANIGLFSLFVMTRSKNPTIYACEPAPAVYDLLKANCDAYGANVHALNIGVSDASKTATFTFYEKSSVFSGFHSDETEDREAIQAIVRNMLSKSIPGESVEEYVKELTAGRMARKSYECQLKSLSDIIRENRIDKIDLLKIDAEKAEVDIIEGIEDQDWPKIKQIVLEIHDPTRDAIGRVERLLTTKGFQCAVEQETLLEHAGLFNLFATREGVGTSVQRDPAAVEAAAPRTAQGQRAADNLTRNIQEFSGALRSSMKNAKVPLVLCICPITPVAKADAELEAVLYEAEAALISDAGRLANVHVISSTSLSQRYPVSEYYDPHGHHAGHIPYTSACYAAIGTALVREIYRLKRKPFKVIALDCDNTLWKGVCGEDGPLGVEVTGPYRALQEFMIRQMSDGMLLCLCSKNNEKDALEVFDRRTDMPLKREHLVSWRINWHSKSENMRSLAKELNLGLDSFIFVDDNPVDCADVEINCPGVLTLRLPENAEALSSFLNNIWAFDHAGSTKEDQERTRMYQESSQRDRYREQTFSLKDFIEGLQLRVEVREMSSEQLDRVSQLTFRTNQFNFTTIRRTKKEIEDLLTKKTVSCLVVRVADRFGDYGLVGVLIYESLADRYKVDTFLLSCRVLGRGVEHALVSQLGQLAVADGKKFVEFTYSLTEKNLPALEFITSIGEPYRNEAGTCWLVPVDVLASAKFDPDEKAPIGSDVLERAGAEPPPPRAAAFGVVDRPERLQKIGECLYDVERVTRAIEENRVGKQPLDFRADMAAGSTLETALASIWRRVLGRPRLGINDNFFEAGGTSLRAVQVIAMIKKELNQNLSIVSLFECPTVTLLAAKLGAAPGVVQEATTAAAAQRGQQRRYNTVRRRAS